jgi:DNA-binding NarL/FixJ family response regulator
MNTSLPRCGRGARGYLVKGADGAEIVRAVQSVASGEAVYGGPVARRIVAFFAGEHADSPSARAFPDLTPREREVLEFAGVRVPQPRDRAAAGHLG